MVLGRAISGGAIFCKLLEGPAHGRLVHLPAFWLRAHQSPLSSSAWSADEDGREKRERE